MWWCRLKQLGDAVSHRNLALYYAIGLTTLVVVVCLAWPGLDRGKWADTLVVSAMAAAIVAGFLQGGVFLVKGAIKIHNNRMRNEGRQEEREKWTNWQKEVAKAQAEGKPLPPSPAEQDKS